jgi:serine/threonine protein phosphatase PrpC
VRTADQRSLRIEAAGGPPLGLRQYAHGPYPTTEITLGVGETLLLCTDGLLESRESDLDSGEQRICDLLEGGPEDLDELADQIITVIAGSQRREDDIALLLAKRTGDT